MTENWLLFSFAAFIALVVIVRMVLAYRKALRPSPRTVAKEAAK